MNRALESLRTFTSCWNRNRWQLAVLMIPLIRGGLYVLNLAPPQLDDALVSRFWQNIALSLLGLSALVAMAGVLRVMPILERTGLQALGPFSVIYAIASVSSNPHNGTVTCLAYMIIGACCFARSREITKAMRIVNRRLREADDAAGAR